jgi:hypothetical protein
LIYEQDILNENFELEISGFVDDYSELKEVIDGVHYSVSAKPQARLG